MCVSPTNTAEKNRIDPKPLYSPGRQPQGDTMHFFLPTRRALEMVMAGGVGTAACGRL